jgi:hypothetical protein
MQIRGSLVRECGSNGYPVEVAREVVQEVFAAAAKVRFGFRTDADAAIAIRTEVAERLGRSDHLDGSAARTAFDWPDVLRRARVTVLELSDSGGS